ADCRGGASADRRRACRASRRRVRAGGRGRDRLDRRPAAAWRAGSRPPASADVSRGHSAYDADARGDRRDAAQGRRQSARDARRRQHCCPVVAAGSPRPGIGRDGLRRPGRDRLATRRVTDQRARRAVGGVRPGIGTDTGLRGAPCDVGGVGGQRIMSAMTDGPLIVQSDKTVLLEVDHELANDARAAIAPFAELERAPEHVHTYRITPLALWNARAAGHDAEQVVDALVSYSRYAVPQALLVDVVDTMARYGRLQLVKHPAHGLVLVSLDRAVLEEVLRHKKITPMLGERLDEDTVVVHPSERGHIKQMLLKIGWPAEDLAGYVDGEAHPISLRQDGWHLRDYQEMAAESFWAGGSGVVVLPCGAGKTLVGAAAMAKASATTLILVTNTVAGRQWKRELIARTSLTEDEIGEYSGERKEIRPVTIATYQVITRRTKGEYRHLELFDSRDWGLIVYDEVHLLPAPVFRMTADLQSRRRLGLTATLIREDGREGDVF